MENYTKILHDKYIQDCYKIIKEEENISGLATHDLSHVLRVVEMIKTIFEQLNRPEDYIEAAMIAGLLHDIGCIEGKKGHALRSYEMSMAYFKENQIQTKYNRQILEAIRDHGSSFNSDSLLTLGLIMADKLDLVDERLAVLGYEEKGMRQLQYIKEISIAIQENILEINFITEAKINIEELNTFQFLDKVFQSVISFANTVDITPKIYINKEIWIR